MVELLVSIGILAILISLLIPALSQAREISKRSGCTVHLREIGDAAFFYLQSERQGFPRLNRSPHDGNWQVNYLIWDGQSLDQNFGPFVKKELIPDLKSLYCPTQQSPAHIQGAPTNPWPPQTGVETSAAYGRRPNVSGADLARIDSGVALYADLFHAPAVVESGHRTGLNVGYADGHVRYMRASKLVLHSEMSLPASPIHNDTMLSIWQQLSESE